MTKQKFAWIKTPINTWNRDRKGGHQRTGFHTVWKHNDKRVARRQHAKITRNDLLEYHSTHLEAMREDFEQWCAEIEAQYWEHISDEDYMLEWDDFKSGEEWEDDYYDFMDDDDSFERIVGGPYNEPLVQDRIITNDDVGESLGDILAKALRVNQ